MSQIYFIRHGQASFFSDNYDQLSPLGFRQTARLGEYFRDNGIHLTQVYTGTLRRQQESAQSCLGSMGLDIEPVVLPGLNEHQGHRIVHAFMPDQMDKMLTAPVEERKSIIRAYYKAYFSYSEPWIRGEYDNDPRLSEVEPWAVFRSRFQKALAQIVSSCPPGATIGVFTSGGTIGAAMGESLGLSDLHTLNIGGRVNNASYSLFLNNNDRFSVKTFNETPHLDSAELRTMV